MMNRIFSCAATAMLLTISFPAYAERPADRAWLQAGIYRPSFNSHAQVNVPDAPIDGSDISFEGDLGLAKQKTVANVEAGVRITNRLRLEGGYFSLRRNASHVLDRDIRWEETVYPVNTQIGAGFRTDVHRVALGYSLLKTEDAELGIRIGAHVTRFDMFIEGSALVEGRPLARRREQKDKTLPLPHLGTYANYNISPALALHGGANYFELSIDDKKGRLVELSAGVSARITPNIGLGARYRYVDYSLRVQSEDWRGKVDYRFRGPALFIEAAF